MKCDACGAEEKLYLVGNRELCADCARESFDYVPEEDAYILDGDLVTEDELFAELALAEFEE
jgi:hypothetical protein